MLKIVAPLSAPQLLPAHLAACVALGKKNELFMKGHQLVEDYPTDALSWCVSIARCY